MKKYRNYILGVLLLGSLSFLYSFAGKRNNARPVEKIEIKFTNGENLYITERAVNNLLIQNQLHPSNLGKEILDLNKVENFLNTNEMIESAEVFLTVDGNVGARITQRQPIGRVISTESYYIDARGERMPLSPFYSARVPVVMGIAPQETAEAFSILKFIQNDIFLKEHIVHIEQNKNGMYSLGVRGMDFNIFFGSAKNIERKFNNFKAFYQNGLENKKLKLYKTVNLQFGNQVVATKK